MSRSMKDVSLPAVALMFVLMGAYVCTLPLTAEAKKPELTGQERAASVGNKADQSASSADADATSSDEDERGKPDKPRGLERAASAGNKPEEIRNQLRYILILISQLQDAVDGNGIGQELSEFIQNGRVLPEDDSGDESTVPENFTATLINADVTLAENDASTTEDDVLEYSMELEVTASGTDLMIPDEAGLTATSATGIVFSLKNASGTVMTTGTTSAALSSSATASSSDYVVEEGTTETFTITVSFDPAESGEYQLQLEQVQANGVFYDLLPEADFASPLGSA